jgi:hypothetical protein
MSFFSMLKKDVVLQVNYAAGCLTLAIFGSKVQRFINRLQNRLEGGGERRGFPTL